MFKQITVQDIADVIAYYDYIDPEDRSHKLRLYSDFSGSIYSETYVRGGGVIQHRVAYFLHKDEFYDVINNALKKLKELESTTI